MKCWIKTVPNMKKTDASTILAEMSVYGNLSRFSVSVNAQETGTELTVTMIDP